MSSSTARILGAIVLALVVRTAAAAGDLSDEPVALRIGLALDRGSAFTDVIGLAAAAAYPYGSSPNPAGADFLRAPPNDFRLALTGTGSYVLFNGGGSITAGAPSVTYRTEQAGTFILAYTRIDSHDTTSAQGDRFVLRSDEVSAKYSYLVIPELALGAGFRASHSTTRFASVVDGFTLKAETDSTGFEASVGALGAPVKDWLVGLFVATGWTYADIDGAVDVPAPFGPLPLESSDFTRSLNVRGGVGWRPSDRLGVYADLQYLRLRTDEDSAEVGRVFGGVEWLPVEGLALRVGTSRDTDGQSSFHAGLGFYGVKHLQVELGYVYNAFPEVRREFGRAHLFSVSAVFMF